MARIRTIKPEFFTSLSVASLELTARLTFIGLWTHCDDEGRCVDEARLIKAALWPLDDRTAADVEGDLRALGAATLIIRYVDGGRRYLAVAGWKEHQRINRPTPSRIPPPPDSSPTPHGVLREESVRAQSEPEEGAHEPSTQPEMSDSRDGGEPSGPVGSTSAHGGPTPPMSSPNELTESSVSPHGALAEDSRQERKGTGNREQGTERARATTAAPPTATASLAPLATLDPDALDAEIADELSQRTGLDITPPYVGWVRKELLAQAPDGIGNLGLWARSRIRAAEDVRVFLTPDMAAAYRSSQRSTATRNGKTAARPPAPRKSSTLLPEDFRLNDGMRRWAAMTYPAVDVDAETTAFIYDRRAKRLYRADWYSEWQKWISNARPRPASPATGTELAVRTATDQRPRSTGEQRYAEIQALKALYPNEGTS